MILVLHDTRKRFNRKSLSILSVYLALNFIPVVFVQADPGIPKDDFKEEIDTSSVKRIISIRPVTSDKGLKVHIKADGELKDYNAFRILKPNRFVIDLQNVRSSVKQKTWFVKSPFVKKIRLGTTGEDKVKIVFDLFPVAELPCKLLSKGKKLVVAFGTVSASPPISPIPKIKQLPTTSIPAKKGKLAQKGPEETPVRPASMITAVEVEKDDHGSKLCIVANGEITRYDSFYLSAFPRLVIDLFGVHSPVDREKFLFSNCLIKSVKQYNFDKDQVRVVFDFTPSAGPPHLIASKGDRLVYFVEGSSDLFATEPVVKVKPDLPQEAIEQPKINKATDTTAKLGMEKPLSGNTPEKIILHVNSFGIEDKAEQEVNRLEKHGYNSFYQEKEVSGKRRFFVYIGPFNDQQEAAEIGSKLRVTGIISHYTLSKMDGNVGAMNEITSSD